MQNELRWTNEELEELGPTLRSHILAGPKPKTKRVFDQATLKYKFIADLSEKKKCHKCKMFFVAKNPKRIFCSYLCRTEYHKNSNSIKQKMIKTASEAQQDKRIKKMWG
jgi:hypothetical protein